MTPEQLADYILDIKDRYDDATPEEKPHIIEGGIHFLITNYNNEWEMYKIYCMWVGGNLSDGSTLKSFYKIYEPIEEALKGDITKYRTHRRVN
jgi:hypothetical protein